MDLVQARDSSADSMTKHSDGEKTQDIESQPDSNEVFVDKDATRETHQVLDDPEMKKEENRYLWKLDFMILPTISACYFFEYLDRGNVAVSNHSA